ncbi:MAG: DNA-processing protein DprA [Deltaproteobacteria bacterium]|nr:DNA-processing protein DprA [Deltaproteobacteria bacterium]
MNKEQEYWLALTLLPKVGARTIETLVESFGSVAAVFEAPPDELSRRCGLRPLLAGQITASLESPGLQEEKKLLEQHGARLIVRGDADYPRRLQAIRLPPPLLYCRGPAPLSAGPVLSVVGTRRSTRYGEKTTRRMIEELARLRPDTVVVSGLARGIDTVAHRQALDCGLKTMAVLAGGLSRTYPPENRELAEEIAATGALLTEFPMAAPPMGRQFPMRNRIISGLCSTLLVVEAGERSGALITAGFAQNHRRPVLAVPGNLDLPSFAGVNRLIQQGQARLATCGADLAAALEDGRSKAIRQMEMGIDGGDPPHDGMDTAAADSRQDSPPLDGDHGRVVEALKKGALHPDDLAAELGLPIEKLLGLLLELELSGEIYQTAGNLYSLDT